LGGFSVASREGRLLPNCTREVAVPGRLELPTFGLGNRCSIRLSYGTKSDFEVVRLSLFGRPSISHGPIAMTTGHIASALGGEAKADVFRQYGASSRRHQTAIPVFSSRLQFGEVGDVEA
jgi:hypothetical protein